MKSVENLPMEADEEKRRPPVAADQPDGIAGTWLPVILIASLVSSAFSIFVSDLLFGAAATAWVLNVIRTRRLGLRAPGYLPFLLAFVGAVLLSIAFSSSPLDSFWYLKKLSKFFWVILIYSYLRPRHLPIAFRLLFFAVGISSVWGIAQYFWLKDVHLMNRVTGLMSHWMTFSGQLMLCIIALTAYLLFGRRVAPASAGVPPALGPRASRSGRVTAITHKLPQTCGTIALLLLLLLMSVALVVTMTRSSWIGATLGVCLLLGAVRPRWALAAVFVLVVVFFFLPDSFHSRLYSSFDPKDTTNRVRLELWKTGQKMVTDHPLTGVGPRMVRRLYPQYRTTDEFPGWAYQHLHSNAVQIAAEMGLIGLAAWLVLWGKIFLDCLRFRRRVLRLGDGQAGWLALSGIACLIAFLCAGLFEYNFGDSEILTLLLFIVTAPYVAIREKLQTS